METPLNLHKRYILNEEDQKHLETAKNLLTLTIEKLKENGLRETNIEIELVSHIKKELKK